MSARVLLVSPAGTGGWQQNEASLASSLQRLGAAPLVRRTQLGRRRRLLRMWTVGAPLVAAASRREVDRALREDRPELLIMVNATSTLFLPWRRLRALGIPVAIRADAPAGELWPDARYAAHRALERRALSRADVVLSMGPASTAALRPLARRVAEVPIGIEPPVQPAALEPAEDEPLVLAYAGQPKEKGLDRICAAWGLLGERRGRAVLTISSVDDDAARRFLAARGVAEPPGVRWAGGLTRERYLALLASAAAFVAAPRFEGHGIAQLEALAAGVPLVSTPAPGAYEALPLARRLAAELVAEDGSSEALAAAIASALELPPERRREYAQHAAAQVEPFSPASADAALGRVLDALGVGVDAPARDRPR